MKWIILLFGFNAFGGNTCLNHLQFASHTTHYDSFQYNRYAAWKSYDNEQMAQMLLNQEIFQWTSYLKCREKNGASAEELQDIRDHLIMLEQDRAQY